MTTSRELEAIERISQTLFQAIGLDALLEKALGAALDEVGAESGSILLADPETRSLVFECSIGDSPVPKGTRIPWDQGIAGGVFRSGVPAISDDVKKNPAHYAALDEKMRHRTRDMISVPLKSWKGDPIGVLNVLNKKNGVLGDDDLHLLTIVSAFTALAIEQSRLFEAAKLAEVARMLGNVSHDLKNLLVPVLSSADLLAEELTDLFQRIDPAGVRRIAERRASCFQALGLIQRTGARIHHRVKEIADCVQGRSTPPVFAPCDLSAITEDVFETLAPIASARRVRLQKEGFEHAPKIVADQRRLYTALYNLVINAIAEVPEARTIRVSAAREDERPYVAISVADEGPGLTPELLDAILFGRAASKKAEGTGLGMRIVKDVVEAHRGEMTIDTEIGRGTTFTLRLPIDPAMLGG